MHRAACGETPFYLDVPSMLITATASCDALLILVVRIRWVMIYEFLGEGVICVGDMLVAGLYSLDKIYVGRGYID